MAERQPTPICVDREIIEQSVTSVEHVLDGQGWHADPQLMTMHVSIESRTILIAPVPIPMPSRGVGRWLLRMGQNMQEPAGWPVADTLVRENCFGWLFFTELMTNLDMTREEVEALDKPLLDVPGSRQTRVGFGMDILGRTYHTMRVRGSDPVPAGMVLAASVGGTIPRAIHALNRAVAMRMPDAAIFLDALSTVSETENFHRDYDGETQTVSFSSKNAKP